MSSRPTWRMASTEASAVTAAQAAALDLVARLPLVPIAYLVPLAGGCDRAALYRHIAHLAERGLIATFAGPPHRRCRPRQLLLLTNLGLAALAWRNALDPRALASDYGLGRRAIDALIRQLPAVLSSYELLALVAGARHGWRARLLAWHRPWPSAGCTVNGTTGSARGTRLPAYSLIEWHADGEQRLSGGYVLLADAGSLPLLALRSALARLARSQAMSPRATPFLAIATTSHRRVEAWSAVLEQVADSPQAASLEASIHTWDSWRAGRAALPWTAPGDTEARSVVAQLSPCRDHQQREWSDVPRPIDLTRARAAVNQWHLSPGCRSALDVIGRHPFLPTVSLGNILGRDRRWARERRDELVHRGLVRIVAPEEVQPKLNDQHELLEATVRGLTMLAGSMGLSLTRAMRHHGLAGGGPTTAVGQRRALFAHRAHTLGADRVFVRIAQRASCQGDRALLEWRNAAACAHGRVRPDGYGLLAVGGRERGFFLEFDRGTVRPSALRAKFAAYSRYRASWAAARHYDGFPTILVVTTGRGAEERLERAVQAVMIQRGAQLPVLMTTIGWIEAQPLGPLGPIWRAVGTSRRRTLARIMSDTSGRKATLSSRHNPEEVIRG